MAFSISDGRRERAPWWLVAVSVLVAVAFAFPALYLLWRNVTTHADPFGLLFSDRTLPPLWRSLRLAVLVSLTNAVTGTALAWLTSRTDLPGRRLWRLLLPLPLVYPTFVGAAAFIRTLSPGGLANETLANIGITETFELRGLFGAWLVLSLFTYPYVYLTVAARLRGLSGSLEESARLLGDSGWHCFRRIVLPQTASAISAGTLLVFLYTISDFGAVQLMRYDTLTRAIWTTRLNNQPVSFALSTILLAVAAIVVVAERRANRRFPDPARVAAGPTPPVALGRWKIVGLGFVLITLVLGLFAPAVALGDWAADGIALDRQGQRELLIDRGELLEATWNTTVASTLTALAAVLVVLPIAYLVSRYRSRVGAVASSIVVSAFALPGLLVALALLFWTLKTPWVRDHLKGTMGILIFAYVVRFGAQAMGAAQVAVAAVPDRLNEAARSLGAGPVRRLRTIELPIITPGLLAGGGLVLLSTMKELPITLLLAPFDFPTLTTRTFQSFESAFIAEAGITALTLVLLSAVLTWFLVVRRADHLD